MVVLTRKRPYPPRKDRRYAARTGSTATRAKLLCITVTAIGGQTLLGQIGIGMLELFVAFLQAYVFAFLATLFISAAVNPH